MATKSQHGVLVRTHTGRDGALWYATPGDRPVRSELAADLFVRQPWIADAGCVRILGTADNVELILALYSQHAYGNRPRCIQVGGPALLRPVTLDGTTEAILGGMEGAPLVSSVGGWHRMTGRDFVTYLLVQQLGNRSGRVDERVRWLMRRHPAWPAIAFIPDADLASAAHLLSLIVDPRWHVDPVHPDRVDGLYSFLGVSPGNVRAVIERDHQVFRHRLPRLVTTLTTWAGRDLYRTPQDVGSNGRHFLHRVATRSADRADGLLKACRVFLRFLRAVWLDNMTSTRSYLRDQDGVPRLQPVSEYAPQLFVPEHFFLEPAALEAWRQHAEKLQVGASAQSDLRGI